MKWVTTLDALGIHDSQGAAVTIFRSMLKPLGFRKRAANLFRVRGDMYAVLNVQKFDWNPESINLNVGFSAVGDTADGWLVEAGCRVRFVAHHLPGVPSDAWRLTQSGYRAAHDREHWCRYVAETIAPPVVAVMDRCTTVAELRHELTRNGRCTQLAVRRAWQDELADAIPRAHEEAAPSAPKIGEVVVPRRS